MERQPSPAAIASMLLTAPAWQRVGLSHKPLQERAAHALAERIVASLDAANVEPDPRQLALTL